MAPAARTQALACSLLVLLFVAVNSAVAQGGWQTGRATFYGIDGWSIHNGACGLGYQYADLGTGWDVAALADASPEFSGSCGRCYEVRCDPRPQLIDGYGNVRDRSRECKAGDATVVVRTVDACPCVYPGNAYSNSRWCCGDNTDTQGTHFDLSIWAFEKIANVPQGMAGIEFRRVPCDFQPSNPAPAGPTGMPDFEQPSAFGYPGDAFSPGGDISQQQLVKRFDEAGLEQGAMRPMRDFDQGAETVSRGEFLVEQGGGAESAASSSSDNGCTDTPPSNSTCTQEKERDQCGENWLLSGNYCRATCGRCILAGRQAARQRASEKLVQAFSG